MPTNLDWAYLAGVVDGDGHIYLGRFRKKEKDYYYPRIEVFSQDKEYLLEIGKIYSNYSFSIRIGNREWRLSFSLKDVKIILEKLLKYSVIKVKDVLEVLTLQKPSRDRKPNVINWQNMTFEEKQAYLAGMIDSEGKIGIVFQSHCNGFRKDIVISQKNRKFLELLKSTFSGIINKAGNDGLGLRIPYKTFKNLHITWTMIKNPNKKFRLQFCQMLDEVKYKSRNSKEFLYDLLKKYEKFRRINKEYYNSLKIQFG